MGLQGHGRVRGPLLLLLSAGVLNIAPTANEGWRSRVREYHERRRTRQKAISDLRIGETVPLADCEIPEAMIVSLNPLQGYYHGRVYELRRQFIFCEPGQKAIVIGPGFRADPTGISNG